MQQLERVDWTPFDVVSVDLYRSIEVADRFPDGVRALVAQGKPVATSEFGAATYHGAGDRGARGLEVVQYDTETGAPARLNGEYVRDEQGQATYLREVLEVFEAEGVDSAFVFAFALHGFPHRPDRDPRNDLDLASYGIVKVLEDRHGEAYPDMTWEPKAAFRMLADRYRGRRPELPVMRAEARPRRSPASAHGPPRRSRPAPGGCMLWAVRIFLAGASGVLGMRLVPLLVGAGHQVSGMTRSPDKADRLSALGADPVICDVFEAAALRDAVVAARPDTVMHQLTDLPDELASIRRFAAANPRIRRQGTRNLLEAARAAGARRLLAQSVAWELVGDAGAATADLERLVLAAGGVVLRYGQFYGPGTYHPQAPPPPPRVHLDEAARRTVAALTEPSGVVTVVED